MCACTKVVWDSELPEVNRHSSGSFFCTIEHGNTEAPLQITILHQFAISENSNVTPPEFELDHDGGDDDEDGGDEGDNYSQVDSGWRVG